MTNPGILALLIGLIGVASARAEAPLRAQTLSLGGAALASSDNARITMWQSDDGMSAGIAANGASLAESWNDANGLQTGGFLAWQSSIYHIGATLNSSVNGQTILGLDASVGALPGEEGTRYGLRIGTAWAPTDRFTVNPASGLGLAELAAPTNTLNLSLLINHALSPNLSLIGLAEAQRTFGVSPLDGNYNSSMGRLIVGAGIGYKF
jgi:hypothetical protein